MGTVGLQVESRINDGTDLVPGRDLLLSGAGEMDAERRLAKYPAERNGICGYSDRGL